jgi:predicted protein tyrosine phosphatase
MPFIENVAWADIPIAYHYDPGPNNLLIQIVDPDGKFPIPKYPFIKTLQFKFWDDEDMLHKGNIQRGQALQIAKALKEAKENNTNVIVHCMAGICRSGAVVEAAVSIGFDDPEKYRNPNLLVKQYLMEALHGN